MRLLNTKSFQFTEIYNPRDFTYAILSHRWTEHEVSYKEMRKGTAAQNPGYSKILKCCQIASQKGFEWVWIDTCCIDRRSSAELSEAINSMWNWYHH